MSRDIPPGVPLGVPLGVDDFEALREAGLAYVDRSSLLCALLDRPGARVVSLARPSGFGKSLDLSMLRCFFESSARARASLFEDLAVWRAGDAYRAHFQRYPVIHLRLGDLVSPTASELRWALREKLRDLIDEHRDALSSAAASPLDRERLGHLLDGSAPDGLYRRALLDLSRVLHRVYGERALVLVDDCDRPVLAGFTHGYGREAFELVGPVLAASLGENPHLARAVVTRTVPLADDAAAIGLERALGSSPLSPELGLGGFNEAELAPLLEHVGRGHRRDDLRRWYGGHHAEEDELYQPDTIMRFLADSAARTGPQPVAGSLSGVLHRLIERHFGHLRPMLESLLAGEDIEVALGHQVSLSALARDPESSWHLLVCAGWLRATPCPRAGTGLDTYRLAIPNRDAHARLVASLPSERSPQRPRSDAPPSSPPPSSPPPSSPPDLDGLGRAGPSVPTGSAEPAAQELRRSGRPDIEHDAEAFESRLGNFFEALRLDTTAALVPDRGGGADAGRDDGEPSERHGDRADRDVAPEVAPERAGAGALGSRPDSSGGNRREVTGAGEADGAGEARGEAEGAGCEGEERGEADGAGEARGEAEGAGCEGEERDEADGAGEARGEAEGAGCEGEERGEADGAGEERDGAGG